MSMPLPHSPAPLHARFAVCAALALLLGGCSSGIPQKTSRAHDAANYNVQLGVAYMNQGDLARAKEKLDRALSQDADNADVHSARAMLFERMGDSSHADAEFRSAQRLAPHDPKVDRKSVV